jgi:AraC-like DNA-binding protein
MLQSYEEWDGTIPPIPPRSHFYSLAPAEIGTPGVECLTSYIIRLADAHCVLPGALLSKELVPFLKKSSAERGKILSLNSIFKDMGGVNGVGAQAIRWVQLLEALTMRTDLKSLTLSTWAEVLPAKNLLRPTKAWCPACYAEWSKSGQVIHEPLLWSLTVVTACPRHRRRLQMQCPALDCQRSLPWLSPQTRPGYCSYCQNWLGLPTASRPARSERLDEYELEWQSWVHKAVGPLLAIKDLPGILLSRDRITSAISACVEQAAQGKRGAFARILGVEEAKVHIWYRGKSIPVLAEMLRLCYRLDISPLELLTAKEIVINVDRIIPASDPWWLSKELKPPRKRFDVQLLRRDLEAILEEQLEPFPSLQEVARRLGTSISALHRHCPGLCSNIVARHIEYIQACKRKRAEEIASEIRQVALQIHSEGAYPSYDRVAARLARVGCLRNAEAREVWRQQLRELGFQL